MAERRRKPIPRLSRDECRALHRLLHKETICRFSRADLWELRQLLVRIDDQIPFVDDDEVVDRGYRYLGIYSRIYNWDRAHGWAVPPGEVAAS